MTFTLTPPSASAPTPAAGSRRRRIATWITLALVFVVLGIGMFAMQSATDSVQKGRLDPGNHGPEGFNALVTVLREHGVDVVITRSWEDAVDDASGATLAFVDVPALSDDAVDGLLGAADDVVLLEPSARTLEQAFDARFGGVGDGELPADCDFAPAINAGSMSAGQLYVSDEASCFPSGDGAGLLVTEDDHRTIIGLDATTAFTNSGITEAGNAALALGVLGMNERLVWYVPDLSDSDLAGGDASLADLTPPWVTPVILLAGLVAAAAAVWRGRRFGPLVAERLPVTVRVSETLEGRARLYARARDTAHTAAVLRRTSSATVGAHLGLGRRAPVRTVADAAAAALGVPPELVRAMLEGPAPTNDTSLMKLSDDLTRLEAAIGAAVRAEGKRP